MGVMAGHREKFQELLREMFQFDCSDLDFGIYRIMNFKREAVEQFIEKDLPQTIAKELSTGALASQSQVADELKETVDEIREKLGDAVLNGEGVLAEAFHGTPLGKRYLDLQKRAFGTVARPALEAAIFNHLYAFFSRYYDAGDFLSKRRYSRKEKYAIPYNGEEVYLHWANSDQYYVKTGEYFTDYRFKVDNGVTVHFRLQQADVPQNNVKGDKRFFLPLPDAARFDPEAREVVIPFEFRPLNEGEQTKYGQRNQQEAIIVEALQSIPPRLQNEDAALLAVTAPHHRTADGTEVSFLAHHLRRYTQKNTSDFFIHKDLKGFLTLELDFYLKNEVLNLDEMQAGGELRAEGWFQIMRAMKAVGGRIIDFLAQIEDFQKKLFEKRKFIVETQYCITLGNIAEDFYPEIAANDAQWAEWKDLFHIDEEQTDLFTNGKSKKDRRVAFLNAHPTLVLDSRHFELGFCDRLVGSFEDLEEMTDGLLIHSENFQALSLLLEKYSKQVDCIYIDPPYNTDAGPILYKNGFRHSSWLALVDNRLRIAHRLLHAESISCVTIDDCESHRLRSLMDTVFPESELLGVVAIKNNPAGRTGTVGFSTCHEYAFFYGQPDAAQVGRLEHSEAQKARYEDKDELGFFEWTNFRKHGGVNTYRTTRPRQFYPIYVRGERIRVPAMTWDNHARKYVVHEPPEHGEEVLLPVDSKGRERIWDFVVDTTRKNVAHLKVRPDAKGKTAIYRKWRIHEEGLLPQTWWDRSEYSAAEYGTNLLTRMFGVSHAFMFPKSVHAVADCLKVAGLRQDQGGTVLDFYAGSGTTGHAVIQLNRADGGLRRFVLVEMGEYFDTVLLARIKKATFSPEWKDGKPTRQATAEEGERAPRVMKVIRLESYEDALNNIRFTDAPKMLYDFDDYVIRYMLEWEAKDSETLLNIQQLASPFSYRLELGGDEETPEKVVDIPETFAYLLGMHVTTRRVYTDKDRRYLVYRGRIDHREIAVIWRDIAGWEKDNYERDKKFVADQKVAEGADEVFVNGDSLIPNARTLDGLFKSRMFGGL
jgi:adenine-specific DNA-methyltransferase